MQAAVLLGPQQIEIRDVDEPAISSDFQVKVRVKSVGVCGSDAHFFQDGRLAGWVVEDPLILGHECAGEVAAVGSGVKRVMVGDRVAVEPGIPCRKCEWCKRGEYHLCPEMSFMAVPGVNGAFAEYILSEEDFVFPLPDQLTFEEGALMEPLAVAVEATKLADISLGDSVAILGAGTIGILCLQTALAAGATELFVIDINPVKLDFIQRFAPNRVITINASHHDTTETIMRLTGGRGVDKTLETAGTFETFRIATLVSRRGGCVTLVGIPPFQEHPFRASDLFDRTVTINAVYRYVNDYPIAIRLVTKGLVDVKSIVTHRFSLQDVPKALRITAQRLDKIIKGIVNI